MRSTPLAPGRRSRLSLALAALGLVLAGGEARAQTQVKGRVMVMVDTSGSMISPFGNCADTGGDAGSAAVFCDNSIGTTFACNKNVACTLGNGGQNLWPTTIANPSRLYAAKSALNDVINSASGELDFGLSRYAVAQLTDELVNITGIGTVSVPWCNDTTNCCKTQIDGTTPGRCIPGALNPYPNVPGDQNCVFPDMNVGKACTSGTQCVTGVCSKGFCVGGSFCSSGNSNCSSNLCNLTWLGGCGSSLNCGGSGQPACSTTEGGEVLVLPNTASGVSSNLNVLPWIDFTEDYCSSTTAAGGAPRNPELHADGGTPLAGSVRTVKNKWYVPIYQASNNGNCDPNTNALCDQQINCRPYVNVVMTDGGEDCEDSSQWFSDPQKAVTELSAVNTTNPVKTYVIAMSFAQNELCNQPSGCSTTTGTCPDFTACPKTQACVTQNGTSYCGCKADSDCGVTCDGFHFTCGSDGICHHPALASLNGMAVAGGTSFARFASNQQDIEAAFADIVASSVKFEVCNGADDNCNGFIDEGLGVYQDCTANSQCTSNSCSAGRCTCASSTDCKSGFTCASGLCVPACTVGVGACLKTGVTKCSGSGTACCVNDGKTACTPLVAGSPTSEICDGKDDNCNGVVDDCTAGVAGSCCGGGGCTPTAEICDGKDNDCDNIIDNHLTDTGGSCGLDIGICKPGTNTCLNSKGVTVDPTTGANADTGDNLQCVGEITAQATEQCDTLDHNCDGVYGGLTQACYTGPNGTEGVGQCRGGNQQCPACPDGQSCTGAGMWGACVGEVTPTTEVCNGLDDDCNGKTDDVAGTGVACCPSNKCGMGQCMSGTTQCSGGTVQCIGATGPSVEICDGIDNDCNGLTDDVPGLGNTCTVSGACGAGTFVCDTTTKMLVCKASGMTSPEVCNGVDDDCDGTADEPAAVCMNDTRICVGGNPVLCGPVPSAACVAEGPNICACTQGKNVCKNGQVECDGAVTGTAEVCNGKDDDCDGTVDNNAPCPQGFSCYMGACYAMCGTGEFPCPGGYQCDANNFCVPDQCQCTACQLCRNNKCVDACDGVNCGTGFICQCGNCVDNSCVTQGCPVGQICDKVARMCKPDPCAGVVCMGTEVCENGSCMATCAGVNCPDGQTCSQGQCKPDQCIGHTCPEGKICNPETGNCVTDQCSMIMCEPGFACVMGGCVQDPCDAVNCPPGSSCKVNTLNGSTDCVSAPQDRIVGAGSGGLACSTGGPPGRGGGGGLLAALSLLLVALSRRRFRQVVR